MTIRQLEENTFRPSIPAAPFALPANAAFILQFAERRTLCVSDDGQPKPTATDAHTTCADGATPNPGTNESLDWENDD